MTKNKRSNKIILDGGFEFTRNVRELAHCEMCHEPMFCIYDRAVRHYCWQCDRDNVSGNLPDAS